DAITYRGAVSDACLANDHYRIVGGDRLMWAGSANLWPRGRRSAAFKAAIERIYPQLAPIEIEHVWSGVMGFSMHGMPQVGEVEPVLHQAARRVRGKKGDRRPAGSAKGRETAS